jgi:hypothetical protein
MSQRSCIACGMVLACVSVYSVQNAVTLGQDVYVEQSLKVLDDKIQSLEEELLVLKERRTRLSTRTLVCTVEVDDVTYSIYRESLGKLIALDRTTNRSAWQLDIREFQELVKVDQVGHNVIITAKDRQIVVDGHNGKVLSKTYTSKR